MPTFAPMQTTAHLCIVVPCYNPSEEWGPAFALKFNELKAHLSSLTPTIDLVLVNDGHINGTRPAVLDQLPGLVPGIQIISYEQNRGKGYALRQGVQQAQGDIYLITDADFPYTMDSMVAIVGHLIRQGGIAAGNRDLAYYSHVPLFRRLLSKGLRWMLRNLLRLQVTDSQCGLKGFDNAGKTVFLETGIDRFFIRPRIFVIGQKNAWRCTPYPFNCARAWCLVKSAGKCWPPRAPTF